MPLETPTANHRCIEENVILSQSAAKAKNPGDD
jgi:hypothetical protein